MLMNASLVHAGSGRNAHAPEKSAEPALAVKKGSPPFGEKIRYFSKRLLKNPFKLSARRPR